LEFTDRKCIEHYGFGFEVMQGAYNWDVPASAGTHDYDRCIDGFIPRVDWWESQHFLRGVCHQEAYYRYPAVGFPYHIHMISSHKYNTRVGIYVPRQREDYANHRNALSDHSWDPTWFPTPRVAFDYTAWKKEIQNMPISDAEWTKIRAIVNQEVSQGVTNGLDRLFARKTDVQQDDGSGKVTVGDAFNRLARLPGTVRESRDQIIAAIEGK
jgi:hypothetical protein